MKLIQIINNTFFNQYELRLVDYKFCNNSNNVLAILKPRFSRFKINIPIAEVIFNNNYLLKIHPYDCYTIGILYRLLQEGINLIQKKLRLRLWHNNEKITNCINFTGLDYINGILKFEIGESQTKHNVSISDFLDNIYMIRGLGCTEASKLGFIITDYLLDRTNLL